ncbi:hypothetical protein PVAND_009131 [Polypedilum vanderplanki]|uniref:Uncharacterized protein n=1 Tax=Polypedilum vanderplanki TaxID=319348 RepID=A0A9J6CCU5_POLVA|nr:hypothetical protein PVAND_009131 [Polypedilum vanderplanki]
MSETSTQQKRQLEKERQVCQAKLQNEDEDRERKATAAQNRNENEQTSHLAKDKAFKSLARMNETSYAYQREYAAEAQVIDLLKNTKLDFNLFEIIVQIICQV